MRKLIQFAFVFLLAAPAFATTWYVDAVNGGTRYDATYNTSGQCNGKSASAYVSGVNQPCPYNDFRLLYDLGMYINNTAASAQWVISGGDTVIITQNYPSGQTGWRVGEDPSNLTIVGGNPKWCAGVNGWNLRCYNPTIPAGTAGAHTRILGANYANCTAPSAKTQLFGSSGAYFTFNIAGAQYLDVQCLELTTHNTARCIPSGLAITPPTTGCNYNDWPNVPPYTDWASQGIWTDNTETNVLLQDVDIHGFLQNGVQGPFDTITLNRVRSHGNLGAGWNFDDACGCSPQGGGHYNAPGGTFTASYLTVEWNGCLEEYPIVDPIPVQYCFDQYSGTLADGVSGQDSIYGSIYLDHYVSRYNTKNGIDIGHWSGNTVQITDSYIYGNMVGQYKLSHSDNTLLYNDISQGNCHRFADPFPGAPSTYNTYLSLWCRASDQNGINYLPNTVDVGGSFYSSGTTLTGSNTSWTSALIGTYIIPNWAPDSSAPNPNYIRQVTAVASTTSMTIATAFPINIPNAPAPNGLSYNLEQIQGGSTVSSSTVVDVYHSTFMGYTPSMFDDGCFDDHTQPVDNSLCVGYTHVMKDNIFLGYYDPAYYGSVPGMYPNLAPTVDDYNDYYEVQYTSPPGVHDIITDPLFINEPATTVTAENQLDAYNYNLTSSSGAKHTGLTISGQTIDYVDNAWNSPPSMGAIEYLSGGVGFLSTSTSGSGTGIVEGASGGGGTFAPGVAYIFQGTPAGGSTLVSGSGCSGTLSGTTYSGTMPSSSSCDVNFVFNSGGISYTLTVSTSGTGAGLMAGTNCVLGATSYASGTSYSCIAEPTAGTFSSWTGSTCGGTGVGNVYSGTLTANCTVNAVFNLAPTSAPGVMQGIGIFQGTGGIK